MLLEKDIRSLQDHVNSFLYYIETNIVYYYIYTHYNNI